MKKITKTALILATGLSTLLVASNSYAHHTIFSSPLMSCKGANNVFYCNGPSDTYPAGMDTLKSGSINVDSDGSLQIKINGAPATKTYWLYSINYIPTNIYTTGNETGYYAPIWCNQMAVSVPPVDCQPRYQYQYLNNGDGMLGSFTTDSKGKYNGPVKFLAPVTNLPTIFKFNPGTVIPSMSFAVTDDGGHISEFITGISTKLATDNDDD